MSEQQMTVRIVLIVAIAVVLLFGGFQACSVATNRQCNETKRATLQSGNPAAIAQGLAAECVPR